MGPDNSSSTLVIGVIALLAILAVGFAVSRIGDSGPELDDRPPAPARDAATRRLRPAGDALAKRTSQSGRRPENKPRKLPQELGSSERRAAPREFERREPARELARRAAPPGALRGGAGASRRSSHDIEAAGGEQRPGDAGAADANDGGPRAAGGGGAGSDARGGADFSPNAIDRALNDAGIAPETMSGIRQRYDELKQAEAELRRQATAEGWLNSPEFNAQMDAIADDRLAIRDDFGDDAYDLVLFATGQTNRALVNNTAGTNLGFEVGDMIVSYDGVRIFSPDGLAAEIESRNPGSSVTVEVLRQGKPAQFNVPGGPLPIGIEAAQEAPDPLR